MLRLKTIALMSFALSAFPAFGFECHSIDVTFRPYWSIVFGPITMTHPSGFSLRVTKTEDLAGKVVRQFNMGGIGTLGQDSFDIALHPEGSLRGETLSDGLWKAQLEYGGESAELLCQ